MLQTHYVNATTQKTPGGGQVAVNLWTIPQSKVTAQLGTLFATDQNIRICESNPKPDLHAGVPVQQPLARHHRRRERALSLARQPSSTCTSGTARP